MRKALLISLMFSSLATPANSQSIVDRDRDGIKGPVESVRVKKTTASDEDGIRSETLITLTHVVTYDKPGNRIELALYDGNGFLSRRIAHTYDPETNKRSGMITYDSYNSIVRKVFDVHGKNGFEKTRTIEDFNEDGTLYRKTVLTFDSLGDLSELAEYRPDGTLLRQERTPLKGPKLDHVVASHKRPSEALDQLVSFSRGVAEYSDPDSHGNWTRGVTAGSSSTYSSGKKIKTTEVIYREFTYY